jgi:LPXTG-site transpeptidase (sortase) family protein
MSRQKCLTFVVILATVLSLAGLTITASARPLAAATHIDLGKADAFAVLAGSAITNTGTTTITGDVGSYPTPTETGFGGVNLLPPSANYPAGAPPAAKTDLTTAYNNAANLPFDFAIAGGTLGGGQTLLSGVYNSGSTIQLNGSLTLDGGGDPNAVFVFQAGSSLTTASGSTVTLKNGAQDCNIYWQVGSSATLGTTSTFVGTIMADQSITDTGYSTIDGRFLARNAAVTLDYTTISRPQCAPRLAKSFSPASITAGGTSLLMITFTNDNATDATLTSVFTDNLPTGVVIAASPNAATTCTGDGLLTTGSSSVSMPAGYIIPGGGSCTLSVDVTAPGAGAFINILHIHDLKTSAGENITAASALLTSTNSLNVTPTITTTLSSNPIIVGHSVFDSAFLSGTGIGTPSGTVIYTYFSDSACTLNPQIARTVTLTNNGDIPDSNPPITFKLAGTYYWQAIYSGGAGFNGATSDCTSEKLIVNKETPTLTTKASGPITVGEAITDTAHLTGGFAPLGGTMTFDVFAPGDTTCSTPIHVTPWVPVTGAGFYTSHTYPTTDVGVYRWIAHYSGDANNNKLDTTCIDANETSMVYQGSTGPGTTPGGTTTGTSGLPSSLPNTGFAPQRVTVLPAQPAEKAYADLGYLWLEIPRLSVQMPIIGVPQTNGQWDVSWLGNQSGWLYGTAFPTYAGNSVLTGHVYDANGKPGPFVGLNTLLWGDKVIVHAWGTQSIYEVREVMLVGPKSIASVIKHEDLPWVTLISCSGYDEASNSYKYRTVVRAVLMEVK